LDDNSLEKLLGRLEIGDDAMVAPVKTGVMTFLSQNLRRVAKTRLKVINASKTYER